MALLIAELFLRFIYNPFETRVRADRIILPVSRTYTYENDKNFKGIDDIITHTKNSLGFRGPELPLDSPITIITIGGSTTEGVYLSDGKDWPAQLATALGEGYWVNNAGLDGHSTFGHTILMQDYIIPLAYKPDIVIFLVGVNEIGRPGFDEHERESVQLGISFSSKEGLVKSLASYSELASIGLNYFRYLRARERGLPHVEFDLGAMPKTDASYERVLEEFGYPYLENYHLRLTKLISLTTGAGIVPVLITQPYLWGDTTDRTTGLYLGDILVGNFGGPLSSFGAWSLLELYNDVTRKVGLAESILVIDLARELPKDSRLFYDSVHFSNAGAEKVAEILKQGLRESGVLKVQVERSSAGREK